MNKKYTEQNIIDNFKKLTEELGHEPTVLEVDACEYLPPSRTIQRRFGGVQELRKKLGYKTIDHTKGDTRRQIASQALNKSREYEKELYEKLFHKYHNLDNDVRVSRQFAWQQYLPGKGHYSNTTCDVALSTSSHITLIDFFYPQHKQSMEGCIRAKRAKYKKNPVALYNTTHEVIFVSVNPDVTQAQIDASGANHGDITLMSIDTFNKKYL